MNNNKLTSFIRLKSFKSLTQRQGRAAGVAILLVLTASAMVSGPAPALAGGTYYPNETLSVSLVNKVVQGQVTKFVASGKQGDVSKYAGGFNLEVFAKNAGPGEKCSPTYTGEEQASLSDNYERRIVIGLWQGTASTYKVPFVYTFPGTGKVWICAYTTYISDTAAANFLEIDIKGSSSAPAGSGAPVNKSLPQVSEAGGALKCTAGTWTGASKYAYAWLINGQSINVAAGLKGQKVVCQVTATSSTDAKATADSKPFLVH